MPPRRIRLLIVAHSAVSYSGNAEVVRNIMQGVLASSPDTYEVRQVGLRQLTAVTTAGWDVIPTRRSSGAAGERLDLADIDGEITLDSVLSDWRPDLVFIHNDPLPAQRQIRIINGRSTVVAYLSVDGAPLPQVLRGLDPRVLYVTMSHFSREALVVLNGLKAMGIRIACAPVDTERFFPVTSGERAALRQENLANSQLGSRFLVGWVGRNQWRKQIWLNYLLISLIRSGEYFVCVACGASSNKERANDRCRSCGSDRFRKAQGNRDIVLWMHFPTGREVGDWSMDELERTYRIQPGEDVIYTVGCDSQSHLAIEDVPLLYQMWDSLLFLSGGEGFGMPALESMACGVPVIYSNYSSHAEWLKSANAGIAISGVLQPEPPHAILRHISDVYEAIDAVLKLYSDSETRRALGQNGRRFSESVGIAEIGRYWDQIFREALQHNGESR